MLCNIPQIHMIPQQFHLSKQSKGWQWKNFLFNSMKPAETDSDVKTIYRWIFSAVLVDLREKSARNGLMVCRNTQEKKSYIQNNLLCDLRQCWHQCPTLFTSGLQRHGIPPFFKGFWIESWGWTWQLSWPRCFLWDFGLVKGKPKDTLSISWTALVHENEVCLVHARSEWLE